MVALTQAQAYETAYWTLYSKETQESQRDLKQNPLAEKHKPFIQRVIDMAEDPKQAQTLTELRDKKIKELVDNPQKV